VWGWARVGLRFDTPAPPLLPAVVVGGWVVRCVQNPCYPRSAPASGAISDPCDTRPPVPARAACRAVPGAWGSPGQRHCGNHLSVSSLLEPAWMLTRSAPMYDANPRTDQSCPVYRGLFVALKNPGRSSPAAVGNLTWRGRRKGASFLAHPLDDSTERTDIDITSIPNAGMTERLTEGMMAKSKTSKPTDRECTHRDRFCICMALLGYQRTPDSAQASSVHPYQLTFRDILKKR
jgi:hypothetical protein